MKRHAAATERNSGPIAEVLAPELPRHGNVLEIASGTGQHAVFFARRFPNLRWQPSDPDADALNSIAAWAKDAGLANLAPPVRLDARDPRWPVAEAAAILCINMVHISPWAATEGLFSGAGRILGEGAPLVLYGPYLEDDVETVASNLDFDASLRARNGDWGLRNLSRLDGLAVRSGFARTVRYAMPANNLTLVYRKTPS